MVQCDDTANLNCQAGGKSKICFAGTWFLQYQVPQCKYRFWMLSHIQMREKPLSCRRTDDTECHNNLLTLEAAHHGHRWHFHRPSWLMHLLSLLPLLLLVSIQRYWGYRSLSATCMHLVLSKCRQLFVHSFDGRKSLSLSLVLEHLK